MPTPTPAPASSFVPAEKIDPKDVKIGDGGSHFTPASAIDPKDVKIPEAPAESPGQKVRRIGGMVARGTVKTAAATAPIVAGAEMGASLGTAVAPGPGTLVGGVIGAGIGGLAAPASEYMAQRAIGEKAEPPTFGEAKTSAGVAAMTQGVAPIMEKMAEPFVEGVLGISGAGKLLREGEAKTGTEATELAEKQTALQAERTAIKTEAARKALQEHADTIKKADDAADAARQKLRQSISTHLETLRPKAAEEVGASAAEKMISKTPAQFGRQEAQPFERQSLALADSNGAVFDALDKFHKEVGAKFEPYIGKIKDDPLSPKTRENLGGEVARIKQTLEQRGQRISSSDLSRVMDEVAAKDKAYPEHEPNVDIPESVARANARMRAAYEAENPPSTFGQLWGQRGRANSILASTKNPADRWAARELVSAIDDEIPGVPAEIRQQYGFERRISRSVVADVAKARNPQEVGEAIFGSKAKPEPAAVPLSIISFTKRFAPERMDGLRQAFADRYLGNQMDANDLGKLNPQVLKELYGDASDDVIRLLGPEGNVKARSWGELIKSDPNVAKNLEQGVRDAMLKQQNLTAQQALVEGKAALKELGPKYAYVQKKVDAADLPEAKLKILAQELPDIQAGGKEALQKGLGAGGFERYLARRLMFMSMFALTGGMYGALFKKPVMLSAAIAVGAGLAGRSLMRTALTSESGASLYMKALSMRPSPETAQAFGRVAGSIVAGGIVDHIRNEPPPSAAPEPPKPHF